MRYNKKNGGSYYEENSNIKIPFSVVLPKTANSVNADIMSASQIHQKLEKGYSDIEKGNVEDAACKLPTVILSSSVHGSLLHANFQFSS